MPANKIGNEYAQSLGKLYADTPKAVFAAIAVSVLTGGGNDAGLAEAALIQEWGILHENGIVPQPPPKEAK